MFKKMVNGELGLGITFWKYGVLFITLISILTKIFERLLFLQIKGVKLSDYYLRYFTPLKPDTMAILWTLCYASAIIGLIYYCISFLSGIWRSCSKFERSSWLKNITRLGAVMLVLGAALFVL